MYWIIERSKDNPSKLIRVRTTDNGTEACSIRDNWEREAEFPANVCTFGADSLEAAKQSWSMWFEGVEV